MSVTSGGTALKPWSRGGRSAGSAGSAGIVMIFFTFHSASSGFPPLRRSRYHTQIEDERSSSEITTPAKPYALPRVVRRAQLQDHLMLGAEIERLQVAPLAQVPDVEGVTVLSAQQQLGIHAVLHHVRRAPFAGDHRVLAQVPGEVVGQVLRPAVPLPRARGTSKVS